MSSSSINWTRLVNGAVMRDLALNCFRISSQSIKYSQWSWLHTTKCTSKRWRGVRASKSLIRIYRATSWPCSKVSRWRVASRTPQSRLPVSLTTSHQLRSSFLTKAESITYLMQRRRHLTYRMRFTTLATSTWSGFRWIAKSTSWRTQCGYMIGPTPTWPCPLLMR